MTQLLTSYDIQLEEKTPLYKKVLVVAGMMTLMGGTLTGVMTYMNLGYSETFFQSWVTAFLTTALVMMPIGLAMMTIVTKLFNSLLPNIDESKRNLIVGLTMAMIMESIMAFTTTVKNLGLVGNPDFGTQWAMSFITALPVALVLMVTISMTIKPKIERFLRS
ncbi:DUF2798 domain-containing protein [Vibrio astriarenae]|uniref:DUF2798 domain-containing protein n=1 Tax=Vibrio astriarenae TaxID=1481923 RepID=UPI003736DF2C